MTTVIVGGGASGLMAACNIKQGKVILLEKNEKLGKRLYITGKGRCNVTNDCDNEKMLGSIVTNPKFLHSAINAFSAIDTINFFEECGLKLKTERGGRVFPVSDKSSDVIKVLEAQARQNGVDIKLNSEVKNIYITGDKFKILLNTTDIVCENLILATGGVSYPLTGSTGDGFNFLKRLGHTVTPLRSVLVPLILNESVQAMEGLSLKNVAVKVVNGKKEYSQFGEMLFTNEGVSGPAVLSLSSFVSRDGLESGAKLIIDLKPALGEAELDDRILKDFNKYTNKQFKNSLSDLMPSSLIPHIISYCGIDGEKTVNSITKAERKSLINALKNLTFNIKKLDNIDRAVVTGGGVSIKEIDPKSMQSKLINNLYIIGELLDVDALTGGFNIQIAFSSAYLASKSINAKGEYV